ncbi:MAG: acyl-CoA transferase [Oceanicaulis sp.]|jgi:acyl-CoA thioesterase|uniref:thioesterase family protein n=1 Tax=unclassified Oceanicaulis TaxID=2632123 RepID=UPI000C6217DA|nr:MULTISPECIES: thioesterase family protein [unclassified Oceanicaulis]MAB68625.1 acyl-CoA transferase [Oceanicaulis sp.]MBC38623.1 acyl-CoA transferase [Oceanicaulis sp.]MBG36634.1 acyl-CoA transferase [Oceanicaulis sp.]HBU61445.1 thioesterase family protein [Oceanicaulis sp.]|tara:strand:+ start:1834 stop:2622 length:789 start_codon:yes stop_codon:yes gene_type:complete
MSIAQLLAHHDPALTTFELDVPDQWKQGRTVYGGLSSGLCLQAALPHANGRPLRSAMINFVGPSAGLLTVEAEKLREGRTACSVRARLSGEAGIGVETVFTFAGERESAYQMNAPRMPERATAPDAGTETLTFPDGAPVFTRNFEFVWAGGGVPFTQSEKPVIRMWVRHADPAARDMSIALLTLGDALAPALAPLLSAPTPLSSMTWMVDFLTDEPRTRDGWWLLESRADHVRGGFSTQDMTIWNTNGECVAKGRQMVTVFG